MAGYEKYRHPDFRSRQQHGSRCARAAERWPARIAAVISNRADAPGWLCGGAGIPTAVVANKDYASRAEFDAALQTVIDGFAPDLVVLAGFMRILTPPFVEHYAGRMLNIHPSLLPLFPGLDTTGRHSGRGAEHGATVHFVTAELDHGPMVAQAAVPVMPDDTVDTLSARCSSRNMSFIRGSTLVCRRPANDSAGRGPGRPQ
jgi:phosphoribosylglycinamide formyltransferase-1